MTGNIDLVVLSDDNVKYFRQWQQFFFEKLALMYIDETSQYIESF